MNIWYVSLAFDRFEARNSLSHRNAYRYSTTPTLQFLSVLKATCNMDGSETGSTQQTCQKVPLIF